MFGLKLKKKKKNKAEKGLVLANKAAQGEAFGGELTAMLGPVALTEWTPPWMRMGLTLHRDEVGNVLPAESSDPADHRCGPRAVCLSPAAHLVIVPNRDVVNTCQAIEGDPRRRH